MKEWSNLPCAPRNRQMLPWPRNFPFRTLPATFSVFSSPIIPFDIFNVFLSNIATAPGRATPIGA